MPNDELLPHDLDPGTIGPVDSQQFYAAIQIAGAAGTLRMPMESPSKLSVTLDLEDGTSEQHRFADTLMNRAMLAMLEFFGEDRRGFMNTYLRLFALQGPLQSKRMEKWTHKCEDDPAMLGVHMAVFKAAATLPLSEIGKFDEAAFFNEVERLAEGEEDP